MQEQFTPAWALKGGRIDEGLFAQQFLEFNPMICVGGSFFNTEGIITDETQLKKEIYDWISPFVTTSVAKKVTSLLEILRLVCLKENLPFQEDTIHIANGTYTLAEGFCPDKQICRYRLPVCYNENAGEPKRWLSFLDSLLEPEDIDTLQEYMGYALIPVTRAQKMLTLVGSGGEGKSRIGVVMKAILGENMATGSLNKVELNAFARADLENLLLFVDDDLKMEALSQTHHLKAIITADTPMDLERKGKQSYQGYLHSRFLAFGNSSLQALHDRSHGFFRRQIILRVKPLDPNRINDPYLGGKLIQERDAIFLWALTGLYRLIANSYRFTVSKAAEQNLSMLMEQNNNIKCFLESEGYIRLDPLGTVSSRALYECYRDWCCDNAVNPYASKTMREYLADHAGRLRIIYSTNIDIGGGRKARGYKGIRLCGYNERKIPV